jgi:hypothetical protein
MLKSSGFRHYLTVSCLAGFVIGFGSQVVAGPTIKYENIDPASILLGYEATFQTRTMSDKDEDYTFSTPHKEKKIREYVAALIDSVNQAPINVDDENMSEDFKPSITVEFKKEKYLVNLEPGVIEVNKTPRTILDLKKSWVPAFRAAEAVGMKATIEKLGEGAGGGHIHMGGKTPKENPFIRYPLLLRNILVYTHQHPSLLFAFSEANDIGREASMKTLHEEPYQSDFQKLIADFDSWYDAASKSERRAGLRVFLENAQTRLPILFSHDVFINLEHIVKLLNVEQTNEKLSVEWRNIRPLSSPEQVEAMAELLLKQADHFSEANLKVPFHSISAQQFLNFLGPRFTESDWSVVKRDLGINDPRLDEMVYDYTRNKELDRDSYRNGKVMEAYTDPDVAEPNREILLPLSKTQGPDSIRYKGINVRGNVVEINGKSYIAAVLPKKFVQVRCENVFLSK